MFINSIWGTQDPIEPGHMLYSYPMSECMSKPTAVSIGGIGFSSQFESFWYCYTTPIDQWTKIFGTAYMRLSGVRFQ